jgi:hypothetical protein
MLAALQAAHKGAHRVGLRVGAAAVLEDIGERRPVLAAAESQACGVAAAAPGRVAHRRHGEALRVEPAADALRMRDAALVQIALRRTLLQRPARRIADAGGGLRVPHQQRGTLLKLAQQRCIGCPRRPRQGAREGGQHPASGDGLGHVPILARAVAAPHPEHSSVT